jgi:hypothetical protein
MPTLMRPLTTPKWLSSMMFARASSEISSTLGATPARA